MFGTVFRTYSAQYLFNFRHNITVTFGTAFVSCSAVRFCHFQHMCNFANNTGEGGIRPAYWELYEVFKLERGEDWIEPVLNL